MRWYDKAAEELCRGEVYTHGALVSILAHLFPDLSHNSYHWAISSMLREGKLVKQGFDEYTLPDGEQKSLYVPIYSELAENLMHEIESRFPYVGFTVFETVLMNEFLNHLVAQNTVFVQTDKEVSVFVFRHLQEAGYRNVMYCPSKKDYALYWAKDCIVVYNLISEAPLSPSNPHQLCLEKMLVDLYCDKLIRASYGASEYEEIVRQAASCYRIERPKLLRYARRRHREDELKLILEYG